jgi:N,N-dimethylformamidase beta subunit-like protein
MASFSTRTRCASRWLIAALIAAGALSGCGGAGTSTSHRARGASKAPRARGPYRWLVRTTGVPPSIPAENALPGTTAWRLPGPADEVGGLAYGNVRGYASPETVTAGATVRIAADAPGARRLRISVFRMGWYGGAGGRTVLVSRALPGVHQPPCRHSSATGLTVCHWRPSLSIRIPPALPSGVYIAKLTAPTGASDVLFVVAAIHPAPLVAMLPTATYEAYNGWGGDSLYPGGTDRVGETHTTQGVAVSLARPYDSITGAGQFFARDVAMIRFLERHGAPVSYTTSEGLQADPGQLLHARVALDFGHSEYWSSQEAGAFAAARARGVSLLFLSSDTLAWRIRFTDRQTIVAYKEHAALDPDRAAPSGRFGATAAALTGSRYLGCILARVRQPGPPTYVLAPWHPAASLKPSWLFAGTGLSAASTIPGIVGYELDATGPGTPPGTTTIGGAVAPCMGVEVGEPAPAQAPGLGQSSSTLYTAASGAFVFASGTLSWELGLEPVPSASPQAPRSPEPALVRMTLNLIRHALVR